MEETLTRAQAAKMGVLAGLMSLDKNNLFHPNWTATRGELARGLALLTNMVPSWREVPLRILLVPGSGQVWLERNGTKKEVTSATEVLKGDRISTGPASGAELKMDDGSSMALEANTDLKLLEAAGTRFVLPDGTPGSAVEDLQVDLTRGKIFGALAPRNEVQESSTANTSFSPGEGDLLSKPIHLEAAGDGWALALASKTPAVSEQGWTDKQQGSNIEWWKQPYQKKVRVKVRAGSTGGNG